MKRSHRAPADNLVAYIGPPHGEIFERFFGPDPSDADVEGDPPPPGEPIPTT